MKRIAAMIVLVSVTVGFPVRAGLGYEVSVASVEMSDGVALDVSLYTPLAPAPPGGFPLIVRQHGGGSSKDSEYDVRYALKAVHTNRFAVLMYSHRGHGGSGGVFDFFGERSAADVSELLDWVADTVPRIDVSRTGMWGYSQGGALSLMPAMTDPRIKVVAAGNTFDDLNHALNPNDCFKYSFATGIFALAYKSAAARTDDATALRWGAQWYTDTEDLAIPFVDPITGAAHVRSTTHDAALHSPAAHVSTTPGTVYDTGLNVPVFWTNSWEDALFPADHGLGIVAGLEARNIPTHLWFASGGHEVPETHGPDEAAKELAMLEWFEEFLLGVDHGYASGARPKVEYAQRVPGGGWTHKTAPTWPVPGDDVTLHAAAGGGLGEVAAAATLGTIVNTVASANLATEPILSNRAGPLVSNVPDSPGSPATLRFATDPVAAPLEFTGAPRVAIRYDSTAQRVAQFNVKLWDEHDGRRRMITRGCLSDETPGDGIADFDLWPASHVLAPGHRLVMTVSTVDFPTFKPDTEPQASTLASATLTLNGVSS
ncbi:MAG TPA: CocE/NonD family hydrolase [Actinomycetota bacterium]|nr:CocE/NonD family hydrolase [Actinomycetota bacterium]